MKKKRNKNKSVARIAILAGTVLTSVGIWTAVSQAATPSSIRQSDSSSEVVETTVLAPALDFGASDNFLTRQNTQTWPNASSSPSSQSTTHRTIPRMRTRGS